MSAETCIKFKNCVRMLGHAGACTAAPSGRTLDWDKGREAVKTRDIEDAVTLFLLDVPTPYWADLNDER